MDQELLEKSMANIQPENGTLPIAYALAEAFYQDNMITLPERIRWWVIRNTYGRRPGKQEPRRKMCVFTWTKIAHELKSDRSDVSRAGRFLVETKRLKIEGRLIGIQKDPDLWVRSRRGGDISPRLKSTGKMPTANDAKYPRSTVGKMLRSPYAREILAVKNPNRGVLPDRPPQDALPNGKPDTVRNRVNLGHPAYDPAELPEWDRMNYDVQRDWRRDWDENISIMLQKKAERDYEATL